jgi:FkbM family methyltransferase
VTMRVRLNLALQRGLRRAGFELHPYSPGPVPAEEDVRRAKLLRAIEADVVLDVGANVGQYAKRLRLAGYDGRIVSFEPVADAFAALERNSAPDELWSARRLALGDEDGTAEIHVAANSWSSSLLEMGERHLASAPQSAYVDSQTVSVARLDSVWDEIVRTGERPFLKLDVQGFEMHALRGADEHLDRLAGVQVELALTKLYEGDPPWREVVDHLEARGFQLAGLEPGFEDPESGRMLQADGVFIST